MDDYYWGNDDSDRYYDDYGGDDGSNDGQQDAAYYAIEQLLTDILNNENLTMEELIDKLSALSEEDLKLLGDFVTGLEVYMERNEQIIRQLGGDALKYLDDVQKLSKGLGVIGALIGAISIGNDLSDDQFTIEEQGDALAAIGGIAIATLAGGPIGFVGALVVTLWGDEAYEVLAPILIRAADVVDESVRQFLSDLSDQYENFVSEIPVDEQTGIVDIPSIFGGFNGWKNFNPNGNYYVIP